MIHFERELFKGLFEFCMCPYSMFFPKQYMILLVIMWSPFVPKKPFKGNMNCLVTINTLNMNNPIFRVNRGFLGFLLKKQ